MTPDLKDLNLGKMNNDAESYTGTELSPEELDRLLKHDPLIIRKVFGAADKSDRVIERPDVPWLRLIICMMAVVGSVAFCVWCLFGVKCVAVFKVMAVLAMLTVVASVSKCLALCLIVVYQRFAPENIRKRCKCMPSCSEYMSQAISKYGLIKGVPMGFKRLSKCGVQIRGEDPLP